MIMQLLSTASAALALSTAPQPATAPAPETAPAAEAAATSEPAVAPNLASGMPVKDKTGAVIGTIVNVKAEAGGKRTATIQMGGESFAVDAASLSVDGGAANVNATHDELMAILKTRK